MVLVAIFRVENNTFAKHLQIAIQNIKTTQIILKEISEGDIEKFIKKNIFLLF